MIRRTTLAAPSALRPDLTQARCASEGSSLLRIPRLRVGLVSTLAILVVACLVQPLQADPPPNQERMWLQALWLQPLLERAGAKVPRPESVRMVSAILRGSRMGPGDGWFGPSRSRYNWDWLRKRFPPNKDGAITHKEFRGPSELFDRLDRDRDGAITAEDFDWSPKSPFLKQLSTYDGWFRMLDGDSNGRVSRKEWQAWFERMARGKDHITPEDLSLALLSPRGRKALAGKPSPKQMEQMRAMLLHNLLKGDLGSPYEGPRPGMVAPDFTLPTHDGKGTVSLSEFRGRKPVVLIFGNFT